MAHRNRQGINRWLERFAHRTTQGVGSSWAFLIALAMTVLWLASGPVFGYTDTWQLVMNTLSSIVTFLMVFLIQRSQNKDSAAIQMKLNELIAADPWASNRLIDIEDFTEEEVAALHQRFRQLAREVREERRFKGKLSVEQKAAGEAAGPGGDDDLSPA